MELESLAGSITATRSARDNAARMAQRARALGIPSLGADMDILAASYDSLLAKLLLLQDEIRTWADD